jgi:hypothetical protein
VLVDQHPKGVLVAAPKRYDELIIRRPCRSVGVAPRRSLLARHRAILSPAWLRK